ncbi:MAG: radical SAM protein, partial [Nitrospirae bacterium]|nr:radical SAM protein [Nitrospirota bacterium]
ADRLSPLIRHASTFQFSSIEPLLHKDIFGMMDIVSAYNRHITFPLLSNGMLLNAANIKELMKREVPSVAVSLDGYTKEMVESFKTGVNFDKVVDNIRLLKEMSKGRIFITTVYIVTSENVNNLIEYIKFCHKLGVNQIVINGFFSFFPELSHLY